MSKLTVLWEASGPGKPKVNLSHIPKLDIGMGNFIHCALPYRSSFSRSQPRREISPTSCSFYFSHMAANRRCFDFYKGTQAKRKLSSLKFPMVTSSQRIYELDKGQELRITHISQLLGSSDSVFSLS